MFGPEKVLKSEKGLLISTNYFWTGPRIKKEWDHLPATFCLQPQADYYTSDEVECNAGKNLWVSVNHHQGMNKRILWWHHSFIWIEYCDYIEIVTDLGIIVGDSLRDSRCNIACQLKTTFSFVMHGCKLASLWITQLWRKHASKLLY